jgi:hypothetical protein
MYRITTIRARAGTAARGVILALPILASIAIGLAIAETKPPSQITGYLERVTFVAPHVPRAAVGSTKKTGSEYELWCNG